MTHHLDHYEQHAEDAHAGLCISMREMSSPVRENHDGRAARKGKTSLSEVQGTHGGAGPEWLLRQNQTQELTVHEL
jgi:hypothetical protein